MLLERRAVIRPQLENRHLTIQHLLLVPHVLVANDEQLKAGVLGEAKKLPVGRRAPAELGGGLDIMTWKRMPDLHWATDVEEYFHSASSRMMLSNP